MEVSKPTTKKLRNIVLSTPPNSIRQNEPFIADSSPIRRHDLSPHAESSCPMVKIPSSYSSDRKEMHDLIQNADAKFPILVPDRITKLSAKLRKRASSPGQFEMIESTVEESIEEDEEDNKVFKRLRILSDEEEFNCKRTHLPKFRGRREINGGNLDRCRSLDTDHLPLDKVQEAKNEDDLNFGLEKGRKILWNMVHDMNEFNSKTKRRGSIGIISDTKYKKFSLQSASSKDTIVEEQEKRTVPPLHSSLLFLSQLNLSSTNSSYHGSLHGSYHNSPRFKLKVDEIDVKEKEKDPEDDNQYEDIEMILEEAEDKNLEPHMNKDFQQAKHKLQEEKEFIKKVLKSDVPEANENNLSMEKEFSYINNEPIQEVNEEDNKVEQS